MLCANSVAMVIFRVEDRCAQVDLWVWKGLLFINVYALESVDFQRQVLLYVMKD